jgi:hypothetical protein
VRDGELGDDDSTATGQPNRGLPVEGELHLHGSDFAQTVTDEMRAEKKIEYTRCGLEKNGNILRYTGRCPNFHRCQPPRVNRCRTIPAISLLLQ